jgi:hypothetical protein
MQRLLKKVTEEYDKTLDVLQGVQSAGQKLSIYTQELAKAAQELTKEAEKLTEAGKELNNSAKDLAKAGEFLKNEAAEAGDLFQIFTDLVQKALEDDSILDAWKVMLNTISDVLANAGDWSSSVRDEFENTLNYLVASLATINVHVVKIKEYYDIWSDLSLPFPERLEALDEMRGEIFTLVKFVVGTGDQDGMVTILIGMVQDLANTIIGGDEYIQLIIDAVQDFISVVKEKSEIFDDIKKVLEEVGDVLKAFEGVTGAIDSVFVAFEKVLDKFNEILDFLLLIPDGDGIVDPFINVIAEGSIFEKLSEFSEKLKDRIGVNGIIGEKIKELLDRVPEDLKRGIVSTVKDVLYVRDEMRDFREENGINDKGDLKSWVKGRILEDGIGAVREDFMSWLSESKENGYFGGVVDGSIRDTLRDRFGTSLDLGGSNDLIEQCLDKPESCGVLAWGEAFWAQLGNALNATRELWDFISNTNLANPNFGMGGIIMPRVMLSAGIYLKF